MSLSIESLTGAQLSDVKSIILDELVDIALSRFKWTGVTRDEEDFIEESLLYGKPLMFFNHPNMGCIFSQCTPCTGLNWMNKPTHYRVVGKGLDSLEFPREEIALLTNSRGNSSVYKMLDFYANRLTSCIIGSDSNIQTQRFSTLLLSEYLGKLSLQRTFEKVASGNPVIIADKKSFDTDSIKSISLATPYVADKILVDYSKIWNECMTMLGINNCNSEKKERLVSDEVSSNNEQIESFRIKNKLPREEFIEEVKEKFGIELECKFVLEEVEINGKIHNNNSESSKLGF